MRISARAYGFTDETKAATLTGGFTSGSLLHEKVTSLPEKPSVIFNLSLHRKIVLPVAGKVFVN